jgi:regulator of protease activity HflC (stomatin/prohibitin superfamily)
MGNISSLIWFRHLRSEPSFHVLRYRRGKLIGRGRGLSFWFLPINTSIAEIPVGDRELPFLFHGRSKDFQDVTVQGTVNYRVTEPQVLGERLDFSIDLARGTFLKDPLDQLANVFTGAAQQIAVRYLAEYDVRDLLTGGLSAVQERIEVGLRESRALTELGLEVVSVQVSAVSPTSELEKALQTPTRESLQQEADKATFERRALAVEKERAIAENELQNQIELAKREKTLIEKRGENERQRAQEEVEAKAVEANGKADTMRIDAKAQADWIESVEGTRLETDKVRWETYRNVPPAVLLGLAAQELAGKLQSIEHLNITPDLLSKGLLGLLEAGTAHLKEG